MAPRTFFPLAFLVSCLAAPGVPAAEGAGDTRLALRTAATLYEGIQEVTLDNGLRVYLKPVPGSPVVTTMVAYKVGSADENLDSTGLSHYLEHLMFKGTDRLLPGDIDRITYRNGGANNAYTGEDYTIFHFDFPYDRWEAALRIEADRMRNLRIDERHEFEQEKGTVINELMRNEDEPWDLEMKAILPLLFGKTAPYGHPIIGEREHVRAATAEIIKGHYDRWYHPNNASLVVCGGFDPDRALAAIRKHFGSIPRAKLPPRKDLVAVKRDRPAHLEIPSKFAVARLLMGYNTVRSGDPDYPVLAVLEGLLAGGKTGRLYKAMVEGAENALAVSAGNNGGRYPGWFAIQVEVQPGKEPEAVEKMLLAEVQKLRDAPPAEAELKRVQRTILANALFARESPHGLADTIAQGVTTNDLEYLKNYLPSILAVTPADVQRVARKYFDPSARVVVWSLPPKEEKSGKEGGQPVPPKRKAGRAALFPSPHRGRGVGGEGAAFSLRKARRVELPNGLVLLLYEDHRLPLFVADAEVHDTRLSEPAGKAGLAALTGSLLDEGTTKHTGEQIAAMIENVGGTLASSSGGGGVRVLAPDRKLGLGLLLECLMSPSFPREAFERKKKQLLGEIEEARTKPELRAHQAFLAAVYGSHPLGRPRTGTAKTVEPLTAEDCAAFHKEVFAPNRTTLAVAGDFDSEEIIDLVKAQTKDWKKEPPAPEPPAVAFPDHFTQKIVTMPQAAQLHFFLGHVGIRRDNPDYYKLLVMDHVLGTGPGFTDRLSGRLRDREGLAYTVTAAITPSAGRQPGTFTAYIGTDNDNFARVKKEFLEELNRIRDEKPTDQEVADAKTYLLGNLLLQFTTDAGIAGQLLKIDSNHLGFDYLDDYRKAVSAVTPQDVQAVARKYLDPARMVLVAAGAIDGTGKPLGKAPPPRR
jgi:zinc protease